MTRRALVVAAATTSALLLGPVSASAQSGDATWYGMKGSVGACGVRLGSPHHKHYIAAHLPCGTRLTVRRNHRVAHGRVWDTGPFPVGDLDLGKVVFRKLAPLGAGRIRVRYERRR